MSNRKKSSKINKENDVEYELNPENSDEDLRFVSMDEEKVWEDGKKASWKKGAIIGGSILGVLLVIYFGFSFFFMSHFYFNTEINGYNFSAKTEKDVESYIKEQVKGYRLNVQEKDHQTDVIEGSKISLAYVKNDDIKNALKKQNAFLWPKAFFEKNSTKVTIEVSYDKKALEQEINQLKSVKAEQTPPVNAYPKFNGTEYVVEPEILGTAVNMEQLQKEVETHIQEFQPTLNMEKEGCYALPKFTKDSKEVKAACDQMNAYIKASITYPMDENVVVDKEIISTWLTVDDAMNVTFNENGVREWLTAFGDKYDTMGGTRSITTPWGKTTEVSGGDYGWSIDEDTEFTNLINSIKAGEVVTREPAYYNGGRAASHGPQDWGSTYLEVDLSAQHMWFVVDGAVAMESDVVTGVPIPEKETTPGVWLVKEMSRNATLVGAPLPGETEPEYRTKVSFWMRITWSGIGFHDATWQSAFGGSRYADGFGSHGCINMPYDAASQLYSMLSVGTPAVVHY